MSGGGGFVGMPSFAQSSPSMWQGVGMARRVASPKCFCYAARG